jgi:hypothetical protein
VVLREDGNSPKAKDWLINVARGLENYILFIFRILSDIPYTSFASDDFRFAIIARTSVSDVSLTSQPELICSSPSRYRRRKGLER